MVQISIPKGGSTDFIAHLQQVTPVFEIPNFQQGIALSPEIIIHALESAALWGAVASGITAYFQRNKHTKVVIEKDGTRIEISGMSAEKIEGLIKGTNELNISTFWSKEK